jgi:splicing factor 3B subunit 3
MHLYNVTLQSTSSITHSLVGSFMGLKGKQEIILGRNNTLELLRVDPTTGQIHSIYQQHVFGLIRSLQTFRLHGSKKGNLLLKDRFCCTGNRLWSNCCD